MMHDHIATPNASRQHLIGESRAFPNPSFDKLLEDASFEDLVWLDGALSDQLDGLPHYVEDEAERRQMFVQISDRLALVRRFAELRAGRKRALARHTRLWTALGLFVLAGAVIAGRLSA
ncbi:MAG: hypothetical protein AB7R90_17965 [Reyranellaceae bacterium]